MAEVYLDRQTKAHDTGTHFIEGSGRGVSRKIIRGMIEHNGKEPDFELRGEALRVTLYA